MSHAGDPRYVQVPDWYSTTEDEAKGCPCWREQQVNPECPVHGKPEFREGGEFHAGA